MKQDFFSSKIAKIHFFLKKNVFLQKQKQILEQNAGKLDHVETRGHKGDFSQAGVFFSYIYLF